SPISSPSMNFLLLDVGLRILYGCAWKKARQGKQSVTKIVVRVRASLQMDGMTCACISGCSVRLKSGTTPAAHSDCATPGGATSASLHRPIPAADTAPEAAPSGNNQ